MPLEGRRSDRFARKGARSGHASVSRDTCGRLQIAAFEPERSAGGLPTGALACGNAAGAVTRRRLQQTCLRMLCRATPIRQKQRRMRGHTHTLGALPFSTAAPALGARHLEESETVDSL